MPRNVTATELGLAIGTIVRIERSADNRTYTAVTIAGQDISDKIESYALKNAFRAKKALVLAETKTGATQWRQVSLLEFDKATRGQAVTDIGASDLNIAGDSNYSDFETQEELVDFINTSYELKPRKLKIPETAWKFAIRTVLRGRNMIVLGPTGCGKTLLCNALKVALGKEDKFFYVNAGSTQDPRSTLIGNTHFDKQTGTYVALSYFAKAIQVPGALIMLDELSRAHPDAINILMPVLDYSQRWLRVDEKSDSDSATIRVAPGVSFIMPANVGSEYTATRTMDRALLDRAIIFEMQPLLQEEELENLLETFPNVLKEQLVSIATIAAKTRAEVHAEAPRIDTIMSTRMSEELAGCVYDGLTLAEGAEMCIYPYFSDAGGAESPRTFMRTLVQQFLPTDDMANRSTQFQGQNPNKRETPWG